MVVNHYMECELQMVEDHLNHTYGRTYMVKLNAKTRRIFLLTYQNGSLVIDDLGNDGRGLNKLSKLL